MLFAFARRVTPTAWRPIVYRFMVTAKGASSPWSAAGVPGKERERKAVVIRRVVDSAPIDPALQQWDGDLEDHTQGRKMDLDARYAVWATRRARDWINELERLCGLEKRSADVGRMIDAMKKVYPKVRLPKGTCSLYMMALKRDQRSAEAMRLFNKMKRERIDIEAAAYTALIAAQGSANQVEETALRNIGTILDTWDKQKYQPNLLNCNAALGVYARAGAPDCAIEMIEKMANPEWALTPDTLSWSLVVRAFSRAGDLAGAHALSNELISKNMAIDRLEMQRLAEVMGRAQSLDHMSEIIAQCIEVHGEIAADTWTRALVAIALAPTHPTAAAALARLGALPAERRPPLDESSVTRVVALARNVGKRENSMDTFRLILKLLEKRKR